MVVTTTARSFACSVGQLGEQHSITSQIGAVVIGRNEGERLHRCLESLTATLDKVVYVDSGSTDGSCEFARNMGVEVVQLDLSVPFTAARARNEGVQSLLKLHPDISYIQVVDGDCIVANGWLRTALKVADRDRSVAVVCGQRREMHPNASRYNRLCNMEWKGNAGFVASCGGDALIRVTAFRQVGGYNAELIAGEEPEMCVRLRQAGWKIQRTTDDMTWHDAAMTRFSQWWKRAKRAGHAYAEGHAIHGKSAEKFRRTEMRSIVFWGGVVPFATIALAVPSYGFSVLVASYGYANLCCRIRNRRLDQGDGTPEASLYAKLTVLGKIPQILGVLEYYTNRLFRRKTRLIEYK
jgi:GT2 family glycosyltransferase